MHHKPPFHQYDKMDLIDIQENVLSYHKIVHNETHPYCLFLACSYSKTSSLMF